MMHAKVAQALCFALLASTYAHGATSTLHKCVATGFQSQGSAQLLHHETAFSAHEDQARQSALDLCRASGGSDCEVVGCYETQDLPLEQLHCDRPGEATRCFAYGWRLAGARNSSGLYLSSVSGSEPSARALALEKCQSMGGLGGCRVIECRSCEITNVPASSR